MFGFWRRLGDRIREYIRAITLVFLAFIIWFIFGYFLPDHDYVNVTQADDEAGVGILFNGMTEDGEDIVCRVLRSDDGKFQLENVYPVKVDSLSEPAPNPLVAFSVDRAPTWVDADWTEDEDLVTVKLNDPIRIEVVFRPVGNLTWDTVISGSTLKSAMEASIDETNAMFAEERFGVVLDDTWTDLGGADAWAASVTPPNNVTGADAEAKSQFLLGKLVQSQYTKGRLNVYVTRSHPGGDAAGYGQPEVSAGAGENAAAILLGHSAVEEILAHEVGHVLGLSHTDTCPGFDGTAGENFMDSDSGSERAYVAEGQTMRAHFRKKSALHSSLSNAAAALDSPPGSVQAYVSAAGWIAGFGNFPPQCWRIWEDEYPANDDGDEAVGNCKYDPAASCAPGSAVSTAGDFKTRARWLAALYMRQSCFRDREWDPDRELRRAARDPRMRTELQELFRGFVADGLGAGRRTMEEARARRWFQAIQRTRHLVERHVEATRRPRRPAVESEVEFVDRSVARRKDAFKIRARRGLGIVERP